MAGHPKARTTGDINRFNQGMADAAFARRWLPTVIDLLELQRDPLRGTDYGRAGGHGGISDPTPLQLVHARYDGDLRRLRDRLRVWSELSRLIAVDVARYATKDERSKKEGECTGGLDREGYEEWMRPCDAQYERKTGENARLCAACIRRKNRWEQDQRDLQSA